MKTTTQTEAPTGVALVEESVHLLRRLPLGWWALYLSGTVPWVAGVLWGWSQLTWFAPGPGQRAWIALVMVGLFGWLKLVQAEGAARMMAWRSGQEAAAWNWGRARRLGLAQLRSQAWGLLVLPFAAVLTVPFGWVMAYFQNLTVLGDEMGVAKQAQKRALDWPSQNHMGLLWMGLLAGVVWVNVASFFYLLPWLANRLLGVDNLFATEGVLMFNSTFLMVVTLLAWLVWDPVVKAFYTLRVFYGQARTTGRDLRGELRAVVRRAGRPVLGWLIVSAVVGAMSGTELSAQTDGRETPTTQTVTEVEIDATIEQVLQGDDFRWSLRPLPTEEEENGLVAGIFRAGRKQIKQLVQTLKSWGRSIGDWIDDWQTPEGQREFAAENSGTGEVSTVWKWLVYFLLAIVVGLLVWVLWLAWRQAQRPMQGEVAATALKDVVPDLKDERVHAAQLPWERWLELARECLANGELRLALRALFLAQLARLGAEGLLRLRPSKTNLDYERELARTAIMERGRLQEFQGRRQRFESVWYGRAEVESEVLSEWLTALETQTPAEVTGGRQ